MGCVGIKQTIETSTQNTGLSAQFHLAHSFKKTRMREIINTSRGSKLITIFEVKPELEHSL